MKKEEGKAFDLNTEETTQKVLEVGTSTNETKIDDKTSFENFKVLYDGRIKEKCLADYGTVEDKELLEDTAKELYLTSQELIPDEDTKSEGDLEEEKTKKEEGKIELDNKSKFLAHILNGVISDVQNKFNVIATGELDTADKNKVAVTLKGSTLDLIDATSYLAKAIRRDDVDFTFDDEIKNNTVRCIISPKTKTESKDNEGSEYDYMLLSRLKSDCDYFLGNGNRYEKHLWAGNIDDQIAKMKELYNKLPEKPEWLTMEDIENYEKEMKQDVKTESRDRVAENLPKFVYDLTKSDFDKYGETAWTASEPKKDNNGRTIYEVYRNGKSDFKIADVVAEIQKEFPELKLSLQSTAPGDRVFFVKETKKQESKTEQPKAVKEFRIMDGDKVLKVFSADQENEGYKEMRRMGAELKEKGLPDNLMYKEFRVKNKQVEESLTEAKDGKENPEYKAFAEDMNEIERTINFIKQPKNKDAQEVLADIKDYLNKLWVEKEQHTFGIKYDESKKITEEVANEDLVLDYSKKAKDEITDQARQNFDTLKEIIDAKENKVDVDGFYFSKEAVDILDNTNTKHNLNSFMDLTKADILNMIDDNDSIEEVIDELFKDYKPDSALAWADNFVTIMNKLDTDIIDYKEYDESKKITEETVTIDEISKIHSEINQANSLKEIQDVIDKISDKSLQRQVQITFDEYDKDDNEDMDEDLEEVKDEIIQTLEDNAEYDDEEEPLTEASTPNVEKFIYDLDVDSGNAWSVNYNDRKRGVEVYKNGKSEKTVDDIIKAVTSKYPQLKVSMKGKNTVLFKYDDKNKSLKEESPNTNKIDNIVAQLMEELPDFAQGYRDIIMELGLSKEDFIDMITTENEHQLLKDKNITEDEEKEVYGKIYDTLV